MTTAAAFRRLDGTVVLLVVSRTGEKESLRLQVPVAFSGNCKMMIIDGFIPERLSKLHPRQPVMRTSTEKGDISGGIYERRIDVEGFAAIVLSTGGKFPSLDIPYEQWQAPAFRKGVLKADSRRENFAQLRIPVRGGTGAGTSNWVNCKHSSIDATKADVGKIKSIVPYEKKSDFMEICYPDGKMLVPDGVVLFWGKIPENYTEFSFWVYPRVSGLKVKPPKIITLQAYIEDSEARRHFLALDLDLDRWQRASLSSKSVKLASSGRICIVGNPKLPEYKDGAKVSFELNGFCVVGDNHPQHGKSGLKSSRAVFDKKEARFILSGEPEKYFEYRHQFVEPVELESVSELSAYDNLKYVYKKESQILEISGRFPRLKNTKSDSLDEKAAEKDLSFSLSQEARKCCENVEISKYDDGRLSILVLKALFRGI